MEIQNTANALVEGIIKLNLPVLGGNIHSYEQQIRSAFRRQDRISLDHRTAAWLASYFDILFAANRRLNPANSRSMLRKRCALTRGLSETTAGTAVNVTSIVVGPTSTEGVFDSLVFVL
jgi:hypothetical protein